MKTILLFTAFAATFLVTSARFERVTPPTYINRPTMPPPRFRREAKPEGTVDYEHKIWGNDNAEVTAGVHGRQLPDQTWQSRATIGATYRWKREARPQNNGAISATVDKPFGLPETRPTLNVDAWHNVLQGDNGRLTAGLHGMKTPGQDWGFNARAQGVLEHGNSQLNAGIMQPLNGPQRQPSYNVDYQHNLWSGKNGGISAGIGADKFPGMNWQPHIGIQGGWRFRREAKNDGSISVNADKPLTGSDKRPTLKFDAQQNILQGENGRLTAGVHGQQLPGQDWSFNGRAQGVLQHGNDQLSGSVMKPLSGPYRQESYNVGYQHNFWSDKNGQIGAGVGANKFPGQNWEPYFGIQGTFRGF